MGKLLTFSVAAYNIANYLEQLLGSFDLTDLSNDVEILIVNDGSTDETSKIAHMYQERYPDIIRVIDKDNGGHGSTINTGIEYAEGKYFRAIDGDDWVDKDSLFKLIDLLKIMDVDLVITDFTWCYTDKCKYDKWSGYEPGIIFDFENICGDLPYIRYHNVIYKTSILKDCHLHLDENCFYVDTEFICYPMINIKSAVYYDLPLYCYRMGNSGQSVSNESRVKHLSDSLKVSESLIDFYLNESDNINSSQRKLVLNCVCSIVSWHIVSLATREYSLTNRDEINKFYRECVSSISQLKRDLITSATGKRKRFLLKNPSGRYHLYRCISNFLGK